MASQSLQAMHLSSPLGYLRRACSPRKRGLSGPFSNGYIRVTGSRKKADRVTARPAVEKYGYASLIHSGESKVNVLGK